MTNRFHPVVNTAETVDTQVTLPIELYQAIAQRAEIHGQSVNSEIVALLISLLAQDFAGLAEEFADWEAASDEDWLQMEATLTSQENWIARDVLLMRLLDSNL